MSKKNRNRRRAKNPTPWRPDADTEFSYETHEKVSAEIHPTVPAQPQSFQVPASALGPPRNELEAASPAFQAMRMMGEGRLTIDPFGLVPPDVRAREGILGPSDSPPSHFESVTAGLTVSPPRPGGLDASFYASVPPSIRVPNLMTSRRKVPDYSSDPHDPNMPADLREQLLTPSTTVPDEVPVRTSWTAGQVLEQHTALAEKYVRPSGSVLDYIRYFVTDSYRKNPHRAQGMFYPADLRPLADQEHPDPGTEIAQQISGVIGRGLRDALTYQVTEEMVGVMRQVHDKTMAETEFLDEAELPSPAGFAWLDKPWPILDTWGNYIPIRVLTWDLEYAWASMGSGGNPRGPDRPSRVPCARIGLWTCMDDDVLYGRWGGQEHRARETSDAMGELTFMHIALLPFGAGFAMPLTDEDKRRADSILGIVHTLWMFLGMEIVSTEPAPVPRLSRRQAQRTLRHGQVRVVTLRKIRHVHSGEVLNPRDIDWSCRWVVQGHWRHIDKYEGERHHALREARPGEKHDACGICRAHGEQVRVTWISPYLKGPDGAPLKSADKLVYRLER